MRISIRTLGRSTLFAGVIAVVTASLLFCQTEEKRIIPSFTFTQSEFQSLVDNLDQDIRTGLLERKEYFLELIARILDDTDDLIVLVDKSHVLSETYVPDDMILLREYPLQLGKDTLQLRRIVMPDLLSMVEAARIDDIILPISSTYRSYMYQAGLYERNVATYGEEVASRESAQPGKSQHQLGTTIDFGNIDDSFGQTDAGRWLFEHAWEYGFSLSYPDGYEALTGYRHEIWHYRYIGRTATLIEKEFFNSVQQMLLEFINDNRVRLLSARVD